MRLNRVQIETFIWVFHVSDILHEKKSKKSHKLFRKDLNNVLNWAAIKIQYWRSENKFNSLNYPKSRLFYL